MAQKHNEEMISAPMTRYGRLTLDAQRRQLRSDAFTAAEWTANNPILQLGELGSEKDTNKIKVGDGLTAWNDLPYSGGSEGQTIQVEELPTASADELGKIYQYIGATDANYTNGYFYKCTGAGEPVVYSWSQVGVQPTPEALPEQTGQSGKFLTTDGTDASWGTVKSLPIQTGQSGKFLTTDGTDASWGNALATNSNGYIPFDSSGLRLQSTTSNVGSFIRVYKQDGSSILLNHAIYSGSYDYAVSTYNGISMVASLFVSASGIYGFKGAGSSSPTFNLGASDYMFDTTFTKKLNNGADINIPTTGGTMVVATPPTTDGTYVLKATVSSGTVTLSWVAE